MLSILIPIYNFDVSDLVQELYLQCERVGKPYEILLFDDASTKRFDFTFLKNKDFNHKIFYLYLAENQGRSKIRNQLSDAAKYDLLLFLDCDSKVVKQDFVKQYMDVAQTGLVVCGGRVYNRLQPNSDTFYLHWLYGQAREVKDADARQADPYYGFQSNNFLITKELFNNSLFDERLTQYGHEDTLFGAELNAKHISMLHIDNPIEHLGLETNHVFIQKTIQSIENLYFLYKNNTPIHSRLLSTFVTLKKYRLTVFYALYYKFNKASWEANLLSANPDLSKLDKLKLGELVRLYRTEG